MLERSPVVFIIDDDISVREALDSLIRSAGLCVQSFPSALEFLRSKPADLLGCLVLDVQLPGLSGLDLQAILGKADIHLPIIFITGHGDIPMTVKAMKAGAVEFLTKPLCDQDLLGAIQKAMEQDRVLRNERRELAELRGRLDLLTLREREVMQLVVSGLLNKQVAARLGTSEVTVKQHRARMMHKMQATSLAGLVRTAQRLGIATLG